MKKLDPKFKNNMRAKFAHLLYQLMQEDDRVWFLTGDLGYKIFDDILQDFPDRAKNCGASEQAMMGMAVGLSQEGKIPFVYSITPFLLYRPYETIRLYLSGEKARVVLVGGGRDHDYEHDGPSHDASGDTQVLETLPSISPLWPKTADDITIDHLKWLRDMAPGYINLKR